MLGCDDQGTRARGPEGDAGALAADERCEAAAGSGTRARGPEGDAGATMPDVSDGEERELVWLRRVRDVCRRLAEEEDPQALLPLALDAAIEVADAERGFLVRVLGRRPDGGFKFRVEVARGFDKASLQGSRGSVSRTVVRRVLERGGRGLVTTSDGDRDALEVSSVRDRRVRSIICVPLRLRGEAVGVLYLDHRFTAGAFTEADLPALSTFADQAALAIETAETQAARRQERRRLDAASSELDDLRNDGAAADAALEAVGALPPGERGFGRLVGRSEAMRALYRQIEQAARSWETVLILGESGTGKELVAREVHARGTRPQAPFLSENCAAVAEGLLESELFGHKRGAFTGADSDRPGLFELAGEGTLFLDEVGDTSLAMQSKLLRTLQDGTVRPVGAGDTLAVGCRVLAATNRSLRAMVADGAFRADLYYRLDVLRIVVPPLRQRPEDIPLLTGHFCEQLGVEPLEPTPKAERLLVGYAWPGNVRQLENEVRRLAALGVRKVAVRHLSPEVREGRGVARAPVDHSGKTLAEVERAVVAAALRESAGNKARAARQLGVPRSTLYHLLERHGLA